MTTRSTRAGCFGSTRSHISLTTLREIQRTRGANPASQIGLPEPSHRCGLLRGPGYPIDCFSVSISTTNSLGIGGSHKCVGIWGQQPFTRIKHVHYSDSAFLLRDKCGQELAGRALRAGRLMVRNIPRYFPDDKLLQKVDRGSLANPDERVFKRQFQSIAILRWIVEIGDTASGEASKDTRVICLPVSIVALANDGIGDRIQDPRALAAGSLVEITGILLQQRRQYGAPDECAGNKVGVGSAEALSIALCALSISAEIVFRLLKSRRGPNHSEAHWIHRGLPGQLELLLRGERNCMVVIADVEIWDDAQHSLLLLFLDLIFCHFGSRGYHANLCHSSCKRQGDLRNHVDLSRLQHSRGRLHREALRRNRDLEWAGRDVGKSEPPILVGERLLAWGLIFT